MALWNQAPTYFEDNPRQSEKRRRSMKARLQQRVCLNSPANVQKPSAWHILLGENLTFGTAAEQQQGSVALFFKHLVGLHLEAALVAVLLHDLNHPAPPNTRMPRKTNMDCLDTTLGIHCRTSCMVRALLVSGNVWRSLATWQKNDGKEAPWPLQYLPIHGVHVFVMSTSAGDHSIFISAACLSTAQYLHR